MNGKVVNVATQMWYEEGELELEFPNNWTVTTCLMTGHSRPHLNTEYIKAALNEPIATAPLRELARGKNEVAIIFDDMSRPTRVNELIPSVLDDLKAAGIRDAAIRFICATGSHGAQTFQDYRKKLGEEASDRFPVYNHNIYENCEYVGETSNGTKLFVNSEVMSCDLKIGIGSIIPHTQSGYGGGGKIILPGVSSIDSIETFHLLEIKAQESGQTNIIGPGKYQENPMLHDFDEAAKLAKLDFKIDTIVNGRGQPCAVFMGNPHAEFYEGIRFAAQHYATKPVPEAKVVVVNTYSKGNESVEGLAIGLAMLKEEGGVLVLIDNCPAGIVVHYLSGHFGKVAKGRLAYSPTSMQRLKRLIVVAPYYQKVLANFLDTPGMTISWVKSWPEAMDILTQDFPSGAKVAVVPDGTIQYLV